MSTTATGLDLTEFQWESEPWKKAPAAAAKATAIVHTHPDLELFDLAFSCDGSRVLARWSDGSLQCSGPKGEFIPSHDMIEVELSEHRREIDAFLVSAGLEAGRETGTRAGGKATRGMGSAAATIESVVTYFLRQAQSDPRFQT